MPINRSKPNAKVQGTQGPKDAQAYLKQLEDLLKRNTGTGLFVGQDVSSNLPMYLPGKVANPTGLGETPSTKAYGNGMTQPTPVQRQAPEVYQEPQQEQPITIEDFLNAFEETYNAPENQPSFGDPQLEGVMSTADGGTMLADGTIVYEDGTIRQGDPNAFAIASDISGGVRYSDGSLRQVAPEGIASLAGDRERILYNDGTARYGNYQYVDGQPVDTEGGLRGLVSGIFGQERPITQEYGNINPMEPTVGNVNYGTDIRTKDLSGSQRELKLPVGAEVVQVLYDDGTQYGTQSGHQGYGNSILVRLATGEMLRFSHMSQMLDVKPGDRINPGETFGIPGTTGNTNGEHLDLEYYNAQGKISDPTQFSGFVDPQGTRQKLEGQPAPGTIDQSYNQPQQSQEQVSQKPIQQDGANYQPSPLYQAAQSVAQTPTNVFNAVKEAIPTKQEVGQAIAEASPVKAEFGWSENPTNPFSQESEQARISALSQQPKEYNPFRQLAGNVTERIGDVLGIPEGTFSEVIAGGPTKRTNVALASEIGGETPQAVPGIRQNIKDIGVDIKEAGEQALGKAGEGIKSLGQAGVSALENVFKPKQEVAKRAVGDVSGIAEPSQTGQFSSLMDTASSMANLAKNDVSDPFFKMGGAEMYKQFLKPNAKDIAGGALTMDLFTPDFYKDLGNIASVFGGSKDLGSATEKYVDFEKTKYQPMSKMGYSDEYDRGSIDEYNKQVDEYNNSLNNYLNQIRSSVQGQQSIFTPLPASSSKNIFASSKPSQISSPAMTSANFSLSAPKTAAPSASLVKSAQKSFAAPTASASAPKQASPIQSFASVNKAIASAPKSVQASVSKQIVASKPSNQAKTVTLPTKAVVNFSAPTSASSAQLKSQPAPQSKPKSNVFSKVINTIKNVFRR